MKEPARKQRNADRLGECFEPFAARLEQVLRTVEAQGFRPRIQDAFRTRQAQEEAFARGTSKVRFGFHNVTGKDGGPESLAVDVLDDDHPLGPPTRYVLALAIAARAQGLETGIAWSLPRSLAAGVEAAIAAKNIDAQVKIGFDPTHIQPAGITIQQAKAGVRPTFKAAAKAAPAKKSGGPAKSTSSANSQTHVVRRGETLGGIAKAHGLTLARVLELNPKLREHPNLIHPGDVVRLR